MAAKQSSTADKKKPHGKQNPINMGDVGRATADAEAGRANKRARHKVLEQAKQRAFEQRCLMALPVERLLETIDDPSLLGSEFVAPVSKKVKVMVKKTEENQAGFEMQLISGRVLLLAEPGSKEGCPVVRVVASDFGPIPASSTYMPLTFVFKGNFHPYLSVQATEIQYKIHGLLRVVLKEEIEKRLSARQMQTNNQVISVAKEVKAKLPAPAAVDSKEESTEKAVQLRVTDLTARQRNWAEERNFLFLANELGVVYFRRLVEGGAAKLVLVKTTDDHPLASLLDEHSELRFDIMPILTQGFVPEEGDMHDVRVARKVVQNYLRHVVLKLGFKPTWAKELSTQ